MLVAPHFTPDAHSPHHVLAKMRRLSHSSCRILTKNQQFLIFIKVLLKCLEAAGDPRLNAVKANVMDCAIRNRKGEKEFANLQQVVERRVRQVAGELYWVEARRHYVHYCQKRGLSAVPGC
jgi:hypothetical protein